jgi:hypothetical protein
MKDTACRTKVHATEELLHRIMDAAAYIREQPEMIQRALNFDLKRKRLSIENCRGHFEQYLITRSNKSPD